MLQEGKKQEEDEGSYQTMSVEAPFRPMDGQLADEEKGLYCQVSLTIP